jgi:hypothetical protein
MNGHGSEPSPPQAGSRVGQRPTAPLEGDAWRAQRRQAAPVAEAEQAEGPRPSADRPVVGQMTGGSKQVQPCAQGGATRGAVGLEPRAKPEAKRPTRGRWPSGGVVRNGRIAPVFRRNPAGAAHTLPEAGDKVRPTTTTR